MRKINTEILALTESFAAGKALSVAQKLIRILSKNLGVGITMSTLPLEYENSYGSFAGYLAEVGKGSYLKINFLLSKADYIYSYDVYIDQLSDTPDYTIDVMGLGVSAIYYNMLENLIDDGLANYDDGTELLAAGYTSSKQKIIEKGRPSVGEIESFLPGIERWAEEDEKILNALQKDSMQDVYSRYFTKWIKDKPRYSDIKYYLFVKIVKRFLIERGLTNKTFRKRKKGSQERQIQDPILQSQLEDIAEGISWQEKFDFLRGMLAQIVNGRIQSVYLYGQPGSGKTHETLATLDSLMGKNGYVYFSGAAKPEEFIQILYNHRENEVIVLDDFSDKLLKNQEIVNVLKAALQNQPKRVITYAKAAKKGLDYEPQFEFSSGIVFISNYAKLDAAIASRSMVLELSFSNEEVLEKIETTLENFRPEIPMDMKKKALEYAQELAPGVKTIDYRMLDNILVAMQIGGNWKRMALLLLQSVDM